MNALLLAFAIISLVFLAFEFFSGRTRLRRATALFGGVIASYLFLCFLYAFLIQKYTGVWSISLSAFQNQFGFLLYPKWIALGLFILLGLLSFKKYFRNNAVIQLGMLICSLIDLCIDYSICGADIYSYLPSLEANIPGWRTTLENPWNFIEFIPLLFACFLLVLIIAMIGKRNKKQVIE